MIFHSECPDVGVCLRAVELMREGWRQDNAELAYQVYKSMSKPERTGIWNMKHQAKNLLSMEEKEVIRKFERRIADEENPF